MCDLINRHRKVYGLPGPGYVELRRRLCGTKEPMNPPLVASDPEWDIVASFGSLKRSNHGRAEKQ
jgi:hypothetical protein